MTDEADEPTATDRHTNEAAQLLGPVYRHRLGAGGDYPEIGVVEVGRAKAELAHVLAELDWLRAKVAPAEREACVKLVRTWGVDRERFVLEGARAVVAELARIADAIQARGNT